jgi:PHD/YefM family antitoxin component YafN of YafNO toxin-antitoxin module
MIMITTHERFVIDKNGNRTAVLLDIEEYNTLLQELEELESIKAYDAAKFSDDETIPFEQAIEEIEKQQ